jgi:hypothetical protein
MRVIWDVNRGKIYWGAVGLAQSQDDGRLPFGPITLLWSHLMLDEPILELVESKTIISSIAVFCFGILSIISLRSMINLTVYCYLVNLYSLSVFPESCFILRFADLAHSLRRHLMISKICSFKLSISAALEGFKVFLESQVLTSARKKVRADCSSPEHWVARVTFVPCEMLSWCSTPGFHQLLSISC